MPPRSRLRVRLLLVSAIFVSAAIIFAVVRWMLDDRIATASSPDGKYRCDILDEEHSGYFTVMIKDADGHTLSNGTWHGSGEGFQKLSWDQDHFIALLGGSPPLRADGVCVNDHVVWLPVKDDHELQMLEGISSPFDVSLWTKAFTNASLRRLKNCPGLTTLTLFGPPFSDKSLNEIGPLPNLKILGLYGSSFTDAALDNLPINPNLTTVILQDTSISQSRSRVMQNAHPSVKVYWYAPRPTTQAATQPDQPQ